MKTYLKIRPPVILMECPLEEGYKAQQIGWGTKYDKRYKAFKVPLCPQTLQIIKRIFKEPVVVEGQVHIDEMKLRAQNNFEGRNAMSLAEYPRPERTFKINPRAHQIEGLWYLKNFLGGALFPDCGTGKTAMTLWDIEAKYKEKLIAPSSVLVVGKLMTLFSGWASDTLKFTDLQAEVLWQTSRSKNEIEEIEIVAEHGDRPDSGNSKTFTKTEYYHKSGEAAIIAGPRAFNPKQHVRKQRIWKEVDGVKYGSEQLVTTRRINVRAKNIIENIGSTTADIHVINHEGLILFTKELTERNYEYIVIDESTTIKNPASKIINALKEISAKAPYRRILSGTPGPQGPQDLWSQFYFLDNGLTLGPDYKQFLEQHFDMIQLGTIEAGTYRGRRPCISPKHKRNTLGWIEERLKNRIFRCKLRDCIDLPPITVGKLDVYLSDEQKIHYENMKEAFCTEIDGENIEVTVDLARIMKLRQITGGFIINKEGEIKSASKINPKMQVLEEYLSELPENEKVIIFAIHRAEIEMLLQKFGTRAVSIYGGISDVKKLNAQDRFINDPTVDRIILQPQSAAYGVNGLTVARYLIFYSIDYRADTNYQAIARIERFGQERPMVVKYLLAKNTIDEVVYNVVQNKNRIQQKTVDIQIFKQLAGIS